MGKQCLRKIIYWRCGFFLLFNSKCLDILAPPNPLFLFLSLSLTLTLSSRYPCCQQQQILKWYRSALTGFILLCYKRRKDLGEDKIGPAKVAAWAALVTVLHCHLVAHSSVSPKTWCLIKQSVWAVLCIDLNLCFISNWDFLSYLNAPC